MELKVFLASLPPGGRAAFARKLGIAPAFLSQLEHGKRRVSAPLAVAIERDSNGAVTVEELRPDDDWAYVRTRTPAEAAQ